MPVAFRNYTGEPLYRHPDYLAVRDFLIRANREEPPLKLHLHSPSYTWAMWEWANGQEALDRSSLDHNGIWEDNGQIIAIATYESKLGEANFCLNPNYGFLKGEVLDYALESLSDESGMLQALISDGDREFQRIALSRGMLPSQRHEVTAVIEVSGRLDYRLPEGFSIISMADGWDFAKYHEVLWRGFRHEGEPQYTPETLSLRRQALSGPSVNPELVLAVVAPDGRYAAHCGMWYHPGDHYATVEPVCTSPDFRRMGLGRAAVLEGVRRCARLGARQAVVCSSQQFYYQMGFYPIQNDTFWTNRRPPY